MVPEGKRLTSQLEKRENCKYKGKTEIWSLLIATTVLALFIDSLQKYFLLVKHLVMHHGHKVQRWSTNALNSRARKGLWQEPDLVPYLMAYGRTSCTCITSSRCFVTLFKFQVMKIPEFPQTLCFSFELPLVSPATSNPNISPAI